MRQFESLSPVEAQLRLDDHADGKIVYDEDYLEFLKATASGEIIGEESEAEEKPKKKNGKKSSL